MRSAVLPRQLLQHGLQHFPEELRRQSAARHRCAGSEPSPSPRRLPAPGGTTSQHRSAPAWSGAGTVLLSAPLRPLPAVLGRTDPTPRPPLVFPHL